MFPWLVHLVGKGRRLSDIEYLAIKEFDGKIVTNESARSAIGTVATLTASSGKDMYLARAKISVVESSAGDSNYELSLNGTVIESCRFSGDGAFQYDFVNVGQKVAATQVIKIEWTSETGGANVEGFLECIEETTGESPAV